VVQAFDTGILEGNNEGRGGSPSTTEESRLVVTDEQADDGKRADVDDGLLSASSTVQPEL
jgi:hypothetical protein